MPDEDIHATTQGVKSSTGTGPAGSPPGPPQIPTELSHYRITGKLGQGGMGVVYRAVDKILDRAVAVKVLPYSDTERRRRFYTEAKAASALNHPNIITIHEIGSQEGFDFIVMELVEGQTLRDRLAQGSLPAPEAVRIATQIASALAAAHAKKIVHRDVKPANVMITESGLVKVLDFGLAKLTAPQTDSDETLTASLTVAGTMMGSLAYMSPEQARAEGVDIRSDIFSFGTLLYEMLAGRRPFAGPNTVATLSAILTADPEPLRDIPEALEKIRIACHQKSPDDRPASMHQVKADLENVHIASGWSGAIPAPLQPASSRAWIGTVAIAAAAVAAGVYWFNGGRTGPEPAVLTRLTANAGLAAYPAMSRDGKILAYSTDRAGKGNLDIWVRQTAGTDPMRITSSPVDEYEPEFSADGATIYFRSELDKGGIYAIPAFGGNARFIAPEGRRPRLSPDGKQLAYWTGFNSPNFHTGTTSVFVVTATGGTPRQVAAQFAISRNPLWMPDGSGLLVLARMEPRDSLDWYVVPINGGKAIRTGAFAAFKKHGLTQAPLEYAILPGSFGPDSRSVLFSAQKGDTTNIWRIAFDPSSGLVSGQPEALTGGTGIDLTPTQAVSDPGSIVFATQSLDVNVWSQPIDANTGKTIGEAEVLTQSLAFDGWPSISRDGTKLVYASHQSGSGVAMLQDMATGQSIKITDQVEGEIQPRISPDGRWIAYSKEKERAIYVVPASGGAHRKICERCILANGWSYDAKRLFIEPGTDFEPQDVYDFETGSRTEFIKPAEDKMMINAVHFSPDGAWASFHGRTVPTARTIFVAPANLGRAPQRAEWIPITSGKEMDREAAWSPDGNLIYFLSDRDGFRCIWAQRLDPASKRPSGTPFGVSHFHHTRQSLASVGSNVGAIGLGVAKGRLVYSMGEITGNIWMRKAAAR